MLVNFLRSIGGTHNLKGVAFEKKARDIALEMSDDPLFFSKLHLTADEEKSFAQYRKEIGSIFFEIDAPYLLWLCKCLQTTNGSLLSNMNSYICAVQKTIRGGLNTYKRIGWDAHILYVCQLTSQNFAEGIPSCAYQWNFDVHHIFDYFKEVYFSLSKTSRYILRVGSFLHDIGVTLGVKDHEEKGIPLVEKYYSELGITDKQLLSNTIALNTDEAISSIRAIVGNHQIINQIAAEASDLYIYEKISAIRDSFSFSANLMSIFQEEFVDVMLLLAAADMMAVDDSLLSEEKFEELVEARKFLKQISHGGIYEREHRKYGIRRLISLLPDANKKSAEPIIVEYMDSTTNGNEIYEFLYQIKSISYAMAAIKPLNNTHKSIKLFHWCNLIARTVQTPLSNLILKFDPDINTDKLGKILEAGIDEVIAQRKIHYVFNKKKNTIDINC
jgi:hypothetical protein